MKTTVRWFWCFPQMLIGFILTKITRATKEEDYYLYNIKSGSVSLGTFIFICPAHRGKQIVLLHEKGHSKQSDILGWLYLLIIGLPSLCWCIIFELFGKKRGWNYYEFYTEKWADKLAGIGRAKI